MNHFVPIGKLTLEGAGPSGRDYVKRRAVRRQDGPGEFHTGFSWEMVPENGQAF